MLPQSSIKKLKHTIAYKDYENVLKFSINYQTIVILIFLTVFNI